MIEEASYGPYIITTGHLAVDDGIRHSPRFVYPKYSCTCTIVFLPGSAHLNLLCGLNSPGRRHMTRNLENESPFIPRTRLLTSEDLRHEKLGNVYLKSDSLP